MCALIQETEEDKNVYGKSPKYGYVKFKKKPFYDFFKRLFDIVLSLLALIALAIPLLIIMLIIYIDDPGPVIFKQVRVGKNGKHFVIYKLRSMVINAEDMQVELSKSNQDKGANFKIKHDPRRTKFGKFLRKTSLDELPQLLNILKGDMSIIGPRPFIPDEQENLPPDRLWVKPGLSCYWQIMGKNSLSIEEQVDLDRQYIKERSSKTDLIIIIKTLMIVIFKENK